MALSWPKTAQEASKKASRKANIIDFPSVCEGFLHLLPFSLPTARDGPRAPKDRPKVAREAYRMAPRGPQ
eukprot:4058384-Pyramimonas_sp.AAC.1